MPLSAISVIDSANLVNSVAFALSVYNEKLWEYYEYRNASYILAAICWDSSRIELISS